MKKYIVLNNWACWKKRKIGSRNQK